MFLHPLSGLATSFSWNKMLPQKKILVKDGEINSVHSEFIRLLFLLIGKLTVFLKFQEFIFRT
jgi:hypothetical protein